MNNIISIVQIWIWRASNIGVAPFGRELFIDVRTGRYFPHPRSVQVRGELGDVPRLFPKISLVHHRLAHVPHHPHQRHSSQFRIHELDDLWRKVEVVQVGLQNALNAWLQNFDDHALIAIPQYCKHFLVNPRAVPTR